MARTNRAPPAPAGRRRWASPLAAPRDTVPRFVPISRLGRREVHVSVSDSDVFPKRDEKHERAFHVSARTRHTT